MGRAKTISDISNWLKKYENNIDTDIYTSHWSQLPQGIIL